MKKSVVFNRYASKLCISSPRISGSLVECRRGPKPRAIMNCRLLPRRLRCNLFPYCVNLIEVIYLVERRLEREFGQEVT